MSDSKYYTPSLDEFRDGFEYEINLGEHSFHPDTTHGWQKRVYNARVGLDNGNYVPQDCPIENYRVKFLDEEGIVGCGWGVRGNGGGSYEINTNDGDYWQMNEGAYAPIEEGGIEGLEFWGPDDRRLPAWPKNKSELKQLMKITGINK